MFKQLIKIAIILIVVNISLFGSTSITKVVYEGGISIFDKVAMAEIVLEEDLKNKKYKMEVKVSSVGIVKTLTSNREDTFISEGKIENGMYIPVKFAEIVTKNDYLKKTTYTFDYDSNQILKEIYEEEILEETGYDIINMESISNKKIQKHEHSEYITLEKNDYVSLFLNLSAENLNTGPVGYIDQKDSDDIMLISKTMFEVSKHGGDEIYRISFSKDKSMFFDEAVALDIAFYGDAYLKKISEEKSIIN